MWDPEAKRVQSSYVEPVSDPGTSPGDDPLICLQVNASWIPYIVGSVLQMLQPLAWNASGSTLADILGRVQDLINRIGTAEVCVAPQFRLTAECGLQYSLDGGTTWLDFTDWATNFPLCVRANQAHVEMDPAYSYPPIPVEDGTGTDWVYTPSP